MVKPDSLPVVDLSSALDRFSVIMLNKPSSIGFNLYDQSWVATAAPGKTKLLVYS
jgi:hypothetical protein